MPISKTPVRVGGANAVDPVSNLPMYRLYTTFEANRDAEFIKVFYNQWLESNGAVLEFKGGRSYVVVDQPEVTHIVPGDINAEPPVEDEIVVDAPVYPMFTGWFNKLVAAEWVGAKLGADVLVGAINATLAGMAFDVADNYKVTPN